MLFKTVSIPAAALGAAALLAGPAALAADARSLREVGDVWVDANVCEAEIADAMAEGGWLSSGSRFADAELEVDVNPRGSERALYVATLRGDDDRILFRTGGEEFGYNHQELCEDIGEEITDRLEDRLG
jgi:hypothetical protein